MCALLITILLIMVAASLIKFWNNSTVFWTIITLFNLFTLIMYYAKNG